MEKKSDQVNLESKLKNISNEKIDQVELFNFS